VENFLINCETTLSQENCCTELICFVMEWMGCGYICGNG